MSKLKLFFIATLLFQSFTSIYGQGISRDLYSFDFRMEKLTAPERTALFAQLGYKGFVFAVANDRQRERLKEYLETDAYKSGKLSIPIVYFVVNFEEDQEGQNESFRKTLMVLPKNTDIWVIVKNEGATKEKTLETLSQMADATLKQGANLVLYPHDGCFIETVEEAIPYIEKLNKKNIYLTLHLSHELRAGNGNRLLDVAIKAKPYLKYATISGANVTMNDKLEDWSDVIKPLDEGDFDLSKFVSVLQKIEFEGKTILHTFGILEKPEEHLLRSINKWHQLVGATYQQLNNDLNFILDNPENAFWDKGSQSWYISNLGGEKVTLEKDGYGWITKIDKDGHVVNNRWVNQLDAPTGMASSNGFLYIGDRGVAVKVNIKSGLIVKKIVLPNAEFINDVAAAPDGSIYVSDTFTNRIYKIDKDDQVSVFLEDDGLEYPNGLWVDGNELIVATWGPMTDRTTFETSRKGTLKKVNLTTKKLSNIGKSAPIANFDGVVKYGGYYYGTDWTGGRLLKISNSGEVEVILTGFQQLADLGIDIEKGILMIPEMSKNRFITLQLNHKP